jgi:hypothetical protein
MTLRVDAVLRRMACAVVVLVAGCGEASVPDGIIDADALPTLILEEERRVGSGGDPDVGFAAIGAMDVDRDGLVYVYESRDRQIRVYDAQGRRIRVIGGRGEGPGEFMVLSALGLAGDTLWAVERSRYRLHLFRRTGEIITTSRFEEVSVPVHGGAARLGPIVRLPDGHFLSDLPLARSGEPVPGEDVIRVPRVRFDASGAVTDTVGWQPMPAPHPPLDLPAPGPVQVGGMVIRPPVPPHDTPIIEATADGSVLVRRARATGDGPAEFSVTRYDLAGESFAELRFRYQPGRYEGAVLDTIAMRPVRRAGAPDAALQAVRDAMRYPTYQSPIYTVWPAQDGSAWLRREDSAGPVFRWIVVLADGRVRGLVELTRNRVPLWARADTLWLVETDELDVPWLVRTRLHDPS